MDLTDFDLSFLEDYSLPDDDAGLFSDLLELDHLQQPAEEEEDIFASALREVFDDQRKSLLDGPELSSAEQGDEKLPALWCDEVLPRHSPSASWDREEEERKYWETELRSQLEEIRGRRLKADYEDLCRPLRSNRLSGLDLHLMLSELDDLAHQQRRGGGGDQTICLEPLYKALDFNITLFLDEATEDEKYHVYHELRDWRKGRQLTASAYRAHLRGRSRCRLKRASAHPAFLTWVRRHLHNVVGKWSSNQTAVHEPPRYVHHKKRWLTEMQTL